MIKKSYMGLLLATLTFMGARADAQTEEAAVKKTITNLFEAMKKGDSAMVRASFAPGALLQTVVRNREGKTLVLTEPLDSFLVAIGRPHTEVYDERIQLETLRIDGDLAIAWTPYSFYVGEKFSHCGVDSFQLVRINGAWKILYLADTRRRDKCN